MSREDINPILVEAHRGGIVESFHRGVVCIVDALGNVLFEKGNIQQVCYPRSAMKLLQVIPLLMDKGAAAFNFTLEEIAVMCGSHNGEAEHQRVVKSILDKCGLDESYLSCGAQYPTAKREANALIQNGSKSKAIHNNCSGKHAGMLALSVINGWDLSTYLEPSHPLQQLILKVCSEFYEYPTNKMVCALDGCSAPIYSVPVYNQALAYKNLVTGPVYKNYKIACDTIVKAVSQYPFMVAGSGRYCTDMMQITAPKIIGKTGAEGVFCMTFTEKYWGICIKIDDGKMQPQYNVAQAIIEASGLFSSEELAPIHHYLCEPLHNFNKLKTGELFIPASITTQMEQALRMD
jgi:L-asparaginase II